MGFVDIPKGTDMSAKKITIFALLLALIAFIVNAIRNQVSIDLDEN